MKNRPIAATTNSFFTLINPLVFTFLISLWFVSSAFAEQNQVFTLGEIGNQIVSEGELLNFNIRPPASFGPNVKWTVSGFPEDNIFYDVPAFPGAEGFGAGTTGGRGGKVVKVTNLNRSGEGSLAAALAMKEPRIIVFDVSGVIDGELPKGEWVYAKSGRIYTQNAPVTIAGQTAPGAGITINGELTFISGDGGTYTDNVIARFIRTRSPYHRKNVGDAILLGGHSAVLDHVSGAWGDDETFDLSNLKNATIQWCGIEESAGPGVEWEVMVDSDNDGMPDSWERKVRDYDGNDSITDFITQILPDGDLDGDGATNLEEYKVGSNPLVGNAPPSPEWTHLYDSDNDGLADWWEKQAISFSSTDNIVELADVNPEDDLDGDFNTNLEEYKAGSNPLQKPIHNYGMIMGYDGRNISLHHNFFAHHSDRNPLSGVEILDHRNNVIYNADLGITFHPVHMNNQRLGESFKTNLVGNYFKVGPNSPKLLSTPTYFYPFIAGVDRASIYDTGNFFEMLDEPSGYFDLFDPNLRRGIYTGFSWQQASEKFPVPDVETQPANLAYNLVLTHGGALPYDKITSRNIEEIKTRTGKWGRHIPDDGLMEGLNPSNALIDSDNDGMPDQWETQHFIMNGININRENILNPYLADNNKIVKYGESALIYNGNVVPGTENRYKGYTYVEYYINELADKMILQQLYKNGYNETYLPGYGKEILPTVSWNPTYEQAGTYNVTFTATDTIGNTLSQTIQVVVENKNRSAYIYPAMYTPERISISTIRENIIEFGKLFKFNFYINDIDGDNFTVDINNLPSGAKFTDTGRLEDSLRADTPYNTYEFEWEPKPTDVGKSGKFTIVVTDDIGNIVSQDVLYNVIQPSKNVYTISSTWNEGGDVYPGENTYVQESESKMIIFNPDTGYAISDVIIDGVSIGSIPAYIFENVTNNHTVKVNFVYSPNSINGLLLKLDFNGDTLDSSGLGNNGVTIGSSSPQLTNDRFGSPNCAYFFDGIDDYIKIENKDYFNLSEYTISAWVYGIKDFQNSQYFISKNSRDGSDTMGLFSAWDNLYSSGLSYPHIAGALKDLENKWFHVAIARKMTSSEFFINGQSIGEIPTGYNKDNDLNLMIGARSGASDLTSLFFNGALDDIRIYNHALSAKEVSDIAGSNYYSEIKYVINASSSSGGTIKPNGDVEVLSGNQQNFIFSPQEGYTISDVIVDGVSIGASNSYTFEKVSTHHTIVVNFEESSTSDKQVSSTLDDLVLKLDFSGNMKDSSGRGNDGTTSGENSPELTYDRFGNPDSAYLFDGLDDYIRIKNTNDFNLAEYTISAWIYGEKDFYDGQTIISKNSGDSVDTLGMFTTWDKLYSPGSGYPHTSNILAGKEHQWINVTVVKKLNSLEFFLNGISQGTVETGISINNTLDLIIGARASTSVPSLRFFKGVIDDIRVYNIALSQEEVAINYIESPTITVKADSIADDTLVLKLDFSGNMKDSSGLGNDGVTPDGNSPKLTNDRFGNPENAYLFDGLDDYIRVKNTAQFNLTEYTISAWIYGEKDFYDGQTIISKNSGDSLDTLGMFTIWDKLYSPGSGYPHTSNILANKERQWIHITVVKTANSIEFFFNGVSQGIVPTGATIDNTLDLIIGARANTSIPNLRFFKGAIDDIRVYNKVLSADEILNLTNATSNQ